MKKHLPFLLILLFLLLLHLFLLVNLRFTAWPEMFSYPFLRNNGFLIYKDMIHPYPPILTMVLSYLYKIFGYQLIILKLFTWGLILFNDVMIFLIVKFITKSIKYSVLGLMFYILIQPFLEGNMLWFDLAVVPPILLATYFCLRWLNDKESKYYLLFIGFLFTVAGLIKQTTGLFFAAFVIYCFIKKIKISDIGYLFIGPLILVIPLVFRLWQERALEDFIKWVIVYPFTYWNKFPGYVRMAIDAKELVVLLLLLIPLAILFIKITKQNFKNLWFNLLIVNLLISFILIYPRFSFFHFQSALAFLAIIYSVVLINLKKGKFLLLLLLPIYFLVILRPVFSADWRKETRFFSKEDLSFAEKISRSTKSSQKIYLLGLFSSLYVQANRLPPKRCFDNFGWYLEIPGVQEEILSRWEKDGPQIIYWQEPQVGNWFDPGVYQPRKIIEWIHLNYNKKEKAAEKIWLWEIKK